MGKVWFTSDLHFGHANVIRFCNRPYENSYYMDKALIKNFNAKVHPEDTVYMLGDISFHKPAVGLALIGALNGTKILIQGNHDKYSDKQYKEVFALRLQEAVIMQFNRRLRMSHFPLKLNSDVTKQDSRFIDLRPRLAPSEGVLLCGHVHEKWAERFTENGLEINVGVDVRGYEPISAEDIENIIRKYLDVK